MVPVPMAMMVLLVRMAVMLTPLPPGSLRRRSLFLLLPQLLLLLLTAPLMLQLVPTLPPLLELLLGPLQAPLLLVWFVPPQQFYTEKSFTTQFETNLAPAMACQNAKLVSVCRTYC